MNSEADDKLSAFWDLVAEVRACENKIERLVNKSPAIDEAVKWSLKDAPKELDTHRLPAMFHAVFDLIEIERQLVFQAENSKGRWIADAALRNWHKQRRDHAKTWLYGWHWDQKTKVIFVRYLWNHACAAIRATYYAFRLCRLLKYKDKVIIDYVDPESEKAEAPQHEEQTSNPIRNLVKRFFS